jgi:predicted nucleotidyltransferase
MTTPPTIADALLGRTRAAMLALLFDRADEWFHLRKLARETGASPGTAHRELRALVAIGLVLRQQVDTSVQFKANTDSPVFAELKSLLTKTAGAAQLLRAALSTLDRSVSTAFIYGSVARGEQRAGSDIDVMIVGTIGLAAVLKALKPAADALHREINPTVYTPEEFTRKARAGHSFIQRIIAEPKIFLIGDAPELGQLSEDRQAASPRAATRRNPASTARTRAQPRRRSSQSA